MNENETDDDNVECYDCGDMVDEDTTTTINGNEVCESCVDSSYTSCNDCGTFVEDGEVTTVAGGDSVCDSCADEYYTCYSCDERVHADYSSTVNGDETVCEGCLDRYYSYCDGCSEYYNHDEGSCCADCACESPAKRFSMHNGTDLLDNDERASISLPAGFISDEGIGAIARLLRDSVPSPNYDLYHTNHPEWSRQAREQQEWANLSYSFADAIGTEWQTGKGNFTKRLSRFAHQSGGLRIAPATLSEIGNIARAHSEGSDVEVEFTRELNMSAEDFYHEDSCWWQSYSSSRCALKSNGGIGLRTFGTVEEDEWDYVPGPWTPNYATFSASGTQMPRVYMRTGRKITTNTVTGRAWVMPLKMVNGGLVPTFDTDNPDAFVIFNGYGDLSGYAAARIVAQMNGMTYRKVGLDADPMYINNNSGYVVAPESIADAYTDGHLSLSTDQHSNLHAREHAHA